MDEWQKLIDARKVAEYWMKRYIQAEERLEQYEWISVKDRLPDEEQKVLCVTCDEEIVIAEFSHFSYDFGELGEWHYWGIRPPEFVTHWMPLPEPPESEDDAE